MSRLADLTDAVRDTTMSDEDQAKPFPNLLSALTPSTRL